MEQAKATFSRSPARTSRRLLATVTLLAAAGLALSGPSRAQDAAIALKIHDHRFYPSEIEIASGEKRLLTIENEDATAEEFDSHSLHREKIIPANSKINIFIGPLKAGRYEFVGEFNETTAHGVVIVK